ncbi:DUF1499 domain-containing protein [Methylopila sp. M107]|uniref:DUF1499 domain-containing protein n=1 Tax=Methylopila sp. M107 TaxID=1101190 RepID=UPI000377130B|nr:DUF1499 domain-containing protein [Methylopila sp. M107]
MKPLSPLPRLEKAKPSRIAGLALGLSLFAALVTLYAAVLIRTHAVEASAGFGAFLAGLGLAALAILVAVVAMVVVWRSGRKGGVRSIVAVVVALGLLAGPAYVATANGLSVAMLTDVSTDLADPPRFQRAGADRGKGDLSIAAEIPAAQAAAQRASYPDLGPLLLQLPPDEVSNLAIGLAEERKWRVLGPTSFPRGGPPIGRVEAVAHTQILGLAEDVSIRVRPDGDGARVDMRSASRIGPSDFGSNAARIKSFLADLAAAASAAP